MLLALVLAAIPVQEAYALIVGGEGNAEVRDPGWPEGAAAIFNTKTRIAWWEGPPFGGGQWHAECRGDAKALSDVLADFDKLDVKNKRIVLHDGVGHSFWLAPNNEPAKRDAAKMDWIFMVWQPANWERLRKLPPDLNPTHDDDSGPPAQIDIYTGGNVRWADVTVPKGLKIVDQRLEAHGFTTADGVVLEGKVTDLATGKPVPEARVRLERIEPQSRGGYQHTKVALAGSDAQGHWSLKKVPEGWFRVVIEADGYVPRVAGYGRFDDQPQWHDYASGLARPARVTGRVVDDAGQPLAGADVRVQDITAVPGGHYETASETEFKTGADGQFRADRIPLGKATLWVYKPGYCRPGLGLAISTPKEDVVLTMVKSARVLVTVDFGGKQRAGGYNVEFGPEAGQQIGSFGGSGNINDKNQIAFENVPPGRYVIRGRPNPGSGNQQTEPLTVELKGGQNAEVTLHAK
jgi:hypothetical protein